LAPALSRLSCGELPICIVPCHAEPMRLRPGVTVLVRDAGHLQVGLARPLAFDGLSPREETFLASLEGRVAGLSVTECEEFPRIVEALRENGLLTEDPPYPSLPDATVRLRVVDAITSTIAIGLARAGVGALSIVDPRPTSPRGPFGPSAAGLSLASALARSLRETSPTIRIAGPFERASLEILRGHGALDLAVPRDLTARDIPHLRIVTDEEGIDVGPLVVPGRTPCETCLGIAQAETDPWWPRIALQLGDAGRDAGVRPPEAATLLASGIAVREIVTALRGVPLRTRRWRVPFDGNTIEAVSLHPHPDCWCGAASPIGDTETAAVAAFPSSRG